MKPAEKLLFIKIKGFGLSIQKITISKNYHIWVIQFLFLSIIKEP